MDGVAFACFAVAAITVLALGGTRAWCWWTLLRPDEPDTPPGRTSAPLSLHEVAFLRGGHARVAETGMAGLLLTGRLTVTGRYGIVVRPGPRPRDAAQAAVVSAYGTGGRGRDARQVRDAAARAESLRWVGSRLFDEALVTVRPLSRQYRELIRAHGVGQIVSALLGSAWVVAAAVLDAGPAVAAAVVAAVLAPGVIVARLTPRPPMMQPTREGRRRLAELAPDGAWVRGTQAGRSLPAEDARTLGLVALHGLGALPHATGLDRAVRGPQSVPRQGARIRARAS